MELSFIQLNREIKQSLSLDITFASVCEDLTVIPQNISPIINWFVILSIIISFSTFRDKKKSLFPLKISLG